MYRVIEIINYFIEKSFTEENYKDSFFFTKLPIIAHGWNLALFDEPLIADPIINGKDGPIYEIAELAFYLGEKNEIVEKRLIDMVGEKPIRSNTVLDRVWETYKVFTGIEVASILCRKGHVWFKTDKIKPFISNDLIKEYYAKIIDEKN